MAFVCIGLIFCNIAVFFIYDKNLKKYELENQLRQAQEMQRLQANYYMQLEKSLNESRKQMHDFKNHITTLEHLHEDKENVKAVSYMKELQQQMKKQMDLASFKVKNAALYYMNKLNVATIWVLSFINKFYTMIYHFYLIWTPVPYLQMHWIMRLQHVAM